MTAARARTGRVGGTAVAALLALVTAACGGGQSGSGGTAGGGAGGQAGGGQAGGGQGDIAVGSVLDETGPLNIYGKPMADATKLAIKDINDSGGVLGRKLKLVAYDTQSDNAKYTQFTNQLVVRDRVAVIHGGITSASREAMRPVVDRAKVPYFYNEQYEGGVCDKNVFLTGSVPSQQLPPLISYAVKEHGPKIHVVAADYNYGQISASWVKRFAEENGGQVVKTSFIPLEVSEFGSVINDLQQSRPDVVVSLLVGGNHIAFYRQFASSGLDDSMKIVSPTFGLGNEQVVLSPDESKGLTVSYPYFQELERPANQKFVQMWRQEYGQDYPYITDSAVAVWNGWHLWAEAAKKANSTERDKIIQALESGLTFESPSGQVTLDPGSHHLVQNVSLGQASGKGFQVVRTEQGVPPAFEKQVCDLVKNPETAKQFTP